MSKYVLESRSFVRDLYLLGSKVVNLAAEENELGGHAGG